MESARKICRLCVSECDFNVSLFSNYCRKTNMLDKILVCLRLPIEDEEYYNTICFRCADNIEKYYDFINYIKKAQTRLGDNGRLYEDEPQYNKQIINDNTSIHINNHQHITSYVREQVYDAVNYNFSFVENPKEAEEKETKNSSLLFSLFSQEPIRESFKTSSKDALMRESFKTSSKDSLMRESFKPSSKDALKSKESHIWKTPGLTSERFIGTTQTKVSSKLNKPTVKFNTHQVKAKPRNYSGDLFDSQSQDVQELDSKFEWKLTPDENIIKRLRKKCFGHSGS